MNMGDVVRYTSAKRPPADYAFDDDQYDDIEPKGSDPEVVIVWAMLSIIVACITGLAFFIS